MRRLLFILLVLLGFFQDEQSLAQADPKAPKRPNPLVDFQTPAQGHRLDLVSQAILINRRVCSDGTCAEKGRRAI